MKFLLFFLLISNSFVCCMSSGYRSPRGSFLPITSEDYRQQIRQQEGTGHLNVMGSSNPPQSGRESFIGVQPKNIQKEE